jgi:NADH-quinone oxidoreductase subunit L
MITGDSRLGLMVVAPLVGAVVSFVLGRMAPRIAGVLASFAVAVSFALTVSLFGSLEQSGDFTTTLSSWISTETVSLPLELLFDKLSAVMCLVVTGIGLLIHLYSIGYMAEDKGRARFFSYLNLFIFSMLILVLGKSLPVIFIGWEGVGLCSYLLIGFWFTNTEYASAGRKAFVMNRIGDVGFLVAMAVLYTACGTLDIVELKKPEVLGRLPADLAFLAGLALFFAATGKSAQIPLFTWLPDAMAGPTPVSALIHAATMVTAGVYLMGRMSGVVELDPAVPAIILWVALATSIIAATTALAQNDIKKVLAYSTVSQLGFMFLAVGVGAYGVAIFHVVTHAFFKACLFLSAGSVIHGCHHEQDMRRMGGLWKTMPLTCASYGVATVAIAGIWPLAGYFSKHAILGSISSTHNPLLFESAPTIGLLATLVAVCTAVYMGRSFILTFLGSYRGEGHPHEVPLVMSLPVLVLALLSVGGGLYLDGTLVEYLQGPLPPVSAHGHGAQGVVGHVLGSLPGLIGVGLALALFLYFTGVKDALRRAVWPLEKLFAGKYYVDEVFEGAVVKPVAGIASVAYRSLDQAIVDGSGSAIGSVSRAVGELARRMTSGQVTTYLLGMLLAVSVLFVVFVQVR